MSVNTRHAYRRVTKQVSNVPFVNAIGSQTRGEGVTSIVKPEVHEPSIFASAPPACLNGIEVHPRAGVAEHEFLWSTILLERHQFLKDNVVHRNRSSPAGLAACNEIVRLESSRVPTEAQESPRAAFLC